MSAIKRAWAWCRRNITALLTATVMALGAGIFWNVHRGRVRRLEDEVAIRKARARVSALNAKEQMLGERAGENAAEIAQVRGSRLALQRATVEIEQKIEGMSDEQVEARFRKLF